MSYGECTRIKGEKGSDGVATLESAILALIKQMKIMNMHLALITDTEISEEEVE